VRHKSTISSKKELFSCKLCVNNDLNDWLYAKYAIRRASDKRGNSAGNIDRVPIIKKSVTS
jgi:endogenous inhibitor of DNA gyrase (YacG/DUF329 family)